MYKKELFGSLPLYLKTKVALAYNIEQYDAHRDLMVLIHKGLGVAMCQ